MKLLCFIFLMFSSCYLDLGAGLSVCSKQCEKQNKIFKNYGWDKGGKPFCECSTVR